MLFFWSETNVQGLDYMEAWMNMIIGMMYPKLKGLSLQVVSHVVRASYLYTKGYSPDSSHKDKVPIKLVADVSSHRIIPINK